MVLAGSGVWPRHLAVLDRAAGGDASRRFLGIPRSRPDALGSDVLVVFGLKCVQRRIVHFGQPTTGAPPPFSLRRMVPLNFSCGALNYAPFRLGALARVAWHVRVDGMNASRVSALMAMAGGWYLLVGLAAFGALWLRPSADWGTLGLGLLLLPAGWALGRIVIAKLPGGLFREARPMLNNPRASLECAGLRLLDVLCFTARLLVGAKILGIELGFGEGVLLAVVATFASLVPFGRLGFREAGVAGAAGAIGGIDPGLRDQLSLLDSAAEAAAYVPLGLALSVLWLRPHFKRVQSNAC